MIAWHRFALRCRDLFIDGEDTTWYEVEDENGAVALEWDGPVRPEPVGRSLFARVSRSEGCVAVGVVDLSGSSHGRWSEVTGPGTCPLRRVQVLVPAPEEWAATAAGAGDERGPLHAIALQVVPHRQGRALQVEVPVESGWSVLRLLRRRR